MRNLCDDRPDAIGNGNPDMDDVAQHQEHVPFGFLVQEIEIQGSDDHDDQQIGRRVLGHRLHHLLHIGLRHEWNLEQIDDRDHLLVQIDQHQEDEGHHDHEHRHAEPVVFPAGQIFRTGKHVGEPQGRPGERRRRKPHCEYDPDQGDGHMSPIGPAVGVGDGCPLRVSARRKGEHRHARKADGADGYVLRKSSAREPRSGREEDRISLRIFRKAVLKSISWRPTPDNKEASASGTRRRDKASYCLTGGSGTV